MIKYSKLIRLLILVVFCLSCSQKSLYGKINGTWIFDTEINNLYLKDTSGFFINQYPIIYDFQKDGNLIVKNYNYKDTMLKWNVKPDSILSINDLDYTIHSINKDSIALIDYNRADTFHITYKRPEKIKINLDKTTIEKILLSNIWSNQEGINNNFYSHFEYFDNGTMIYKYKMDDRHFKKEMENLQLEAWGIAQYEDYFFLYNYHNMQLGSNFNQINQIVQIDSLSYTISSKFFENGKVKFVKKKSNNRSREIENKMKGNWISKNSKEGLYGYYNPNSVESGYISFFEGDLLLTLNDHKSNFNIEGLDSKEFSWKVGKDGTVLLLEYKIEEPGFEGIHVELANILEITDTTLKIRLFQNRYSSGKDKPAIVLLNLIQEFKKVDE